MATLIGPELIDPDLNVTGLAAARLFASSRPRPRGADAAPLLSGLTRAPGGTYSSTVEVIHFTDGSSAHTDLIRLNPNIDAYSLDFAGVSPRQLCPTTPSSTCRRSAATCPTCSRPRTPHPPRRRTRSPSTWTPPSRSPRTART